MDDRLHDILRSLLVNIEVLDNELSRMNRSELLRPDSACAGLMENIRDACLDTLQNVHSIERKLQGSAFIIPENVATTLE